MPDAQKTLSIFFMGTAEEISKKTIVSQFAKAVPEEDRLLIEGPNIAGTNIDEQVERAKSYLMGLSDQYTRVNIMGHSRGAVTGRRLANIIAKEINPERERRRVPPIEINLLEVDPVAGLRNKSDDDAQHIPGDVKNMLSFISAHEERMLYTAQDLTFRTKFDAPDKTSAYFLPMYGAHGAINRSKEKKQPEQSTQIGWQMAYNFLAQHGTRFNNIPKFLTKSANGSVTETDFKTLSDKEMLSLYDEMHENKENYSVKFSLSRARNWLQPRKARGFLQKDRERYVRDSHIFINIHERELFKKAYPTVFNYYFENAYGHRNNEDKEKVDDSHKQKVKDELFTLKTKHPQLFKLLQNNHFFEYESTYRNIDNPGKTTLDILTPRGIYHKETSSFHAHQTIEQFTATNLSSVLTSVAHRYINYRNKKGKHHDLANNIIKEIEIIGKNKIYLKKKKVSP